MFNEKDYRDAFSKVTASEETYRRVMNMAKKEKKTPRVAGFIGKVVLAAVLISMLTVTASAAEEIAGWFKSYFSEMSKTELSENQISYIEENVQDIQESQTQDGYTLEVKSAITDGITAYVTIGVTAPEDVDLTTANFDGYSPETMSVSTGNYIFDAFTNSEGKFATGTMSMRNVDDKDGKKNTVNLVYELAPDVEEDGSYPFAEGNLWNIHMKDLTVQYENVPHMKAMEEKYNGQQDIMMTDEEIANCWPVVTIAEGTWDFTLAFEECDRREVELISEPVTVSTNIALNGEYYVKGDITSILFRSLSASVFYEGDVEMNGTYMVMKDGSQVDFTWGQSGIDGGALCQFAAPVILEEVDHIVFPDGTTIDIPELPAK